MRHVSEDLAERLAAAGWGVLTASSNPGRLARAMEMALAVWKWRKRYRIAHVEVYSGAAFAWAELCCLMLRRLGKPYLLTLHGGNLPAFAGKWPRRVGRVLRNAKAVTTPSAYLREKLAHIRTDIRMIPNPIDLSAYQYRKRESLSPSLVWLRSFHDIYNPSMAARVVALLERDFPKITLRMIGPDKRDGSLRKFRETAADLGVSGRITIAGAVPKSSVAEELNRGDIFINTTNFDNAPVSVIEAMACGLCVVSTDAGGLPYLLESGRDALLVPVGDPHAMAEAVRRLLREPRLASQMSENARRKSQQWDWSSVLPQWESLLEGIDET